MQDAASFAQLWLMATTVQAFAAVYDNSTAFLNYLNQEGLLHILKKTKLRLKENHAVVSRVSLPPLPLEVIKVLTECDH